MVIYFMNKEEQKEYSKIWYDVNRDSCLKRNKEYCDIHKEEIKKKYKSWYKRNKLKQKEYMQSYYKTHKEVIIKQQKVYLSNNDVRLKRNIRILKYGTFVRNKIIDFLGAKCVACGVTDKKILCFNHIKEKPKYESTLNVIYKLKSGSYKPNVDIDLRCHNCNVIYEYEVGKRQGLSNYEIKEKVIKLLGSKCVGCSLEDKRILCVNHLIQKPKYEQTHEYYIKILNGIYKPNVDVDLRCFNCNWLYEHEKKLRKRP